MSETLATSPATPAFQKLVAKLREVFQIDQPDLDFGIYRIINARAAEIGDYLENKLRAKVDAALASGQQAGLADLQRDLAAAEQQARELGADPANLPKVKDLRARVAALSGGASEHRDAVFSHLLTFFSRYYDEGDFISQRRYKGDTYAIPYSGEEVVLHWANKDQYYTKSGENFSNYTFALADGRRVHFRLASADTAKDDRKDTDLERRFRLIIPRTITRTGADGEEVQEQQVPVVEVPAAPAAEGRPATPAELILWFEYVPLPKKGDSQDALNVRARETVFGDPAVKARWLDLAQRKPTEKNPQRTLLDKQLEDYTAKNRTDYFIHKDLGGFLRRELDFYIKNEVMHLDDVQNAASFADIEKSLRLIQCLRGIALDLIAFLAQLEDFQKKLWLKKKFVVEAHYCITLDRIYKIGESLDPKDETRERVLAEREWLLAQIAANEKQIATWIDLGLVKNSSCEPVVASTDTLFAQASTVAERLRANPYLMVDTQWFGPEFKYRLLAQLHDLDAQCDGLLVHSENSQGLSFLRARMRHAAELVYTDPPYNTGEATFSYKDGYQRSSWITMIHERFLLASKVASRAGLFLVHIDDSEVESLKHVLVQILGKENFQAHLAWKNKYGPGALTKGYGNLHEHILVFSTAQVDSIETELSEEEKENYSSRDENYATRGGFVTQPLATRSKDPRPNLVYPLEHEGESILPDKQWIWERERLYRAYKDGELVIRKNKDKWSVRFKQYLKDADGKIRKGKPLSLLLGPFNQDGTKAIEALFGDRVFAFPKPPTLAQKLLNIAINGVELSSANIIDFFAGSGTTGQAIIELNREDKGRRKYTLIEVNDYFDTVLMPRLQKAVYSTSWEEGRPLRSDTGISHYFKYLRLESYEDTLNNLALKRPDGLTDLFDPAGKEDYLLHYMLDVESRSSLLSVEDFKKPFDYKLRIATDSAGACQTRAVDLVETFNYLLGLRVAHLDAKLDLGYILVSGKLPDGQSCLIVWRDCEKLGYDATAKLLERHKITPNDNEYDVVYINGDHNIHTVAQATEAEGGVTRQLTLRQIEPEFIVRMFAGEEA